MSSGFVTENELADARKRRQEEWEKVRKADEPMERPEEPYDGKSLYDRLKEQKMKKDMEFEEVHKLKNLIRGLDDDEVQFLELVDQSKLDAEKKQFKEEEKELEDFRNRVATLQEESVDKKIQTEIKQIKPKPSTAIATDSLRVSQKSLVGVGIKRRSEDSSVSNVNTEKSAKLNGNVIYTNKFDKGQFKCIAVLPGIGMYTESSDSEMSSGSDDEPDIMTKYDLVGRKRGKKKQCHEEC